MSFFSLLLAICTLFLIPSRAFSVVMDVEKKEAQRIISILDYMVGDYTEAVVEEGGKIVNKDEYQEMINFITEVKQLAPSLDIPKDWPLDAQIRTIEALIRRKASLSAIQSTTSVIRERMILHYSIPTYPVKFPDMALGKKLYEQSCVSCHAGDGSARTELAKNMEPPPRVLSDSAVLDKLSPFKVFNTLTYGVKNTQMASFASLSEEERWALSAYVFTFRKDLPAPKRDSDPFIHWQVAMRSTDADILHQLTQSGLSMEKSFAQLSQIRAMFYLSESPTMTQEEASSKDPSGISARELIDVLVLKNRRANRECISDNKHFSRFIKPVLVFLKKKTLSDAVTDRYVLCASNEPQATEELENALMKAREVLLSSRRVDPMALFFHVSLATLAFTLPWFLLLAVIGRTKAFRRYKSRLFGLTGAYVFTSFLHGYLAYSDEFRILGSQFIKGSSVIYWGIIATSLAMFFLAFIFIRNDLIGKRHEE